MQRNIYICVSRSVKVKFYMKEVWYVSNGDLETYKRMHMAMAFVVARVLSSTLWKFDILVMRILKPIKGCGKLIATNWHVERNPWDSLVDEIIDGPGIMRVCRRPMVIDHTLTTLKLGDVLLTLSSSLISFHRIHPYLILVTPCNGVENFKLYLYLTMSFLKWLCTIVRFH